MELNTKLIPLEKEVKDGRETTARIRSALSDVSTTIVFLWSYHEIVIFFCKFGIIYVILYCSGYRNTSP